MLKMLSPSQDNHVPVKLRNGHSDLDPEAMPPMDRRDPKVTQRPARRRFTAADKLRILAEAEACAKPGQLGALLRREGLYSSHSAAFKKQRDEGKLARDPNVVRQQRRQKEAARQRDARKIARLEAENTKLKALIELEKVAELIHLD